MSAAVPAVIDQGDEIATSGLSIAEIVGQVEKIQEVVDSVMRDGVHYGRLENEKGVPRLKKPMLYKPGAEKLCLTFRLRPRYEEIGSVHKDSLIAYRYRCVLVHFPTGMEIGEAIGSCNSREKQYAYARANVWDLDNTFLKMATKRSLVGAVLVSTAAGDIFDQAAENQAAAQQYKKLAMVIKDLTERHPLSVPDGTDWETYSRTRASEEFGVGSRSQLSADEMAQVINEIEGMLFALDTGGSEPAEPQPPDPDDVPFG